MKYKLINKQTKEETLCDKVTIDGFDYYVSDESIKQGSYWFDGTNIRKDYSLHLISGFDRKVIATNNPNIDIPKVVDEVEMLGEDETNIRILQHKTPSQIARQYFDGFIQGYNKSQETHPFSEEDMIEFGEMVAWNMVGKTITESFVKGISKEILQLWKEQKPKIVYYE